MLARIAENSPAFFERLVVDLLVRMGYGGSFSEAAAQVVGKSGDGGIDGIINEDKLGLEAIYVQAKRWKGSAGRSEIQKFVGALRGRKKGVFITTGTFTKEAVEFAEDLKDDPRVVQVAGRMETSTVDLMLDSTFESPEALTCPCQSRRQVPLVFLRQIQYTGFITGV